MDAEQTVERVARAIRKQRLIAGGAAPIMLVFNDEAPAEDHDIAATRAAIRALCEGQKAEIVRGWADAISAFPPEHEGETALASLLTTLATIMEAGGE